jgi:hypothetical protein
MAKLAFGKTDNLTGQKSPVTSNENFSNNLEASLGMLAQKARSVKAHNVINGSFRR